jgi:hypothetical protein
VRSRKREDLTAEIEEGAISCVLMHLANISYRLGRTLHWDEKTWTVKGDPEADEDAHAGISGAVCRSGEGLIRQAGLLPRSGGDQVSGLLVGFGRSGGLRKADTGETEWVTKPRTSRPARKTPADGAAY